MKLLRSVREEVELETGIQQSSMLLPICPSVPSCNVAASASHSRHYLPPVVWLGERRTGRRALAGFSHKGERHSDTLTRRSVHDVVIFLASTRCPSARTTSMAGW